MAKVNQITSNKHTKKLKNKNRKSENLEEINNYGRNFLMNNFMSKKNRKCEVFVEFLLILFVVFEQGLSFQVHALNLNYGKLSRFKITFERLKEPIFDWPNFNMSPTKTTANPKCF